MMKQQGKRLADLILELNGLKSDLYPLCYQLSLLLNRLNSNGGGLVLFHPNCPLEDLDGCESIFSFYDRDGFRGDLGFLNDIMSVDDAVNEDDDEAQPGMSPNWQFNMFLFSFVCLLFYLQALEHLVPMRVQTTCPSLLLQPAIWQVMWHCNVYV